MINTAFGPMKPEGSGTAKGIESEIQHQQAPQYQENRGIITHYSIVGKDFLSFIVRVNIHDIFDINITFQCNKAGVAKNNQRGRLKHNSKSMKPVLFIIDILGHFLAFKVKKILFFP